jgi:hypothetical protein
MQTVAKSIPGRLWVTTKAYAEKAGWRALGNAFCAPIRGFKGVAMFTSVLKRLSAFTLVVLIACVSAEALAADNTLTAKEKRQGWKLLFDGKSLNGWGATGDINGWKVENGSIVCLGGRGGYLYTTEKFGDFILSVDFKFVPGANSGIFVRWSDLRDPVNTGIEIQILDSYGRERPTKHDCGAIYDIIAPSQNTCKPAGQWNTAVITCKGPIVSVKLNGVTIAEMDLDKWTEPGRNPDGTRNKFRYAYKDLPRIGHIGLQDHGSRVEFRNIKILPLKAETTKTRKVSAVSSAADLFPVPK